MFSKLVVAVAIALGVASSVVAAPGAAFPPLSEAVKRDLMARDPSEYEVYGLTNSTALGARAPPSNLYGIQERCTASRCFSFTFDDGPYNKHRDIADRLNNEGYKGTFFVNGNNYRCIYDEPQVQALKYSYAQGHEICSHTWSHPHLNSLSNDQIDGQIQFVEDALYKILGVVPACVRPPYGEANQRVVDHLNNRWGLVVVNWNFDTQDASGASVSQSLDVYRGIKAPKHAIVLNHETVSTTPDNMLPKAINIVKQNGYVPQNVQTVATNLRYNPYKVVGKPGVRDSTWTCAGKPQPGAA
ncbi:glycoside hydrolase/deacetylase [Ceraceosorus guamensis]|uniref:Glycoside hydrolase/deacetylase n=1 Tax=Ceraceosorus guamensis TaxID=1522189 RepID=A0A316W3K1_9BASI|nr:glycoside hydrolase/deacetylase [Ceraceosorus guamensis]PWN44370.1 glycoside hydrolase/deacetylase [Ceraceosorus guamensis]